MTNCNYCGEFSIFNVCDSSECQAKLANFKDEQNKINEHMRTTKERDIPGFFGGLTNRKGIRYWDTVHEDGILYRHYLSEDKKEDFFSSHLGLFEYRKRYMDWVGD